MASTKKRFENVMRDSANECGNLIDLIDILLSSTGTIQIFPEM